MHVSVSVLRTSYNDTNKEKGTHRVVVDASRSIPTIAGRDAHSARSDGSVGGLAMVNGVRRCFKGVACVVGERRRRPLGKPGGCRGQRVKSRFTSRTP